MNTPEFLIWAIEYQCPVRGFQDGSDPERTERQLRAARAVSDARCDGRVFDGFCVKPPDGFRIDDALEVYGGLAAVEQVCGACPANTFQSLQPHALARCYGVVPLPADESQMHDAVERAIDRAGIGDDIQRLFPATQPRWYGLWMQSPLVAQHMSVLEALLAEVDRVETESSRWRTEFTWLTKLTLGLQTARVSGLCLHVALYPRGVIEGTSWRPVRHCPRCHAAWTSAKRRQCDVCSFAGHPAPDKKRHARGRRPYFPLDRLLGSEQAKEFLVRYAAFQSRPESPDRARSPHPPAPPDSPPAG